MILKHFAPKNDEIGGLEASVAHLEVEKAWYVAESPVLLHQCYCSTQGEEAATPGMGAYPAPERAPEASRPPISSFFGAKCFRIIPRDRQNDWFASWALGKK